MKELFKGKLEIVQLFKKYFTEKRKAEFNNEIKLVNKLNDKMKNYTQQLNTKYDKKIDKTQANENCAGTFDSLELFDRYLLRNPPFDASVCDSGGREYRDFDSAVYGNDICVCDGACGCGHICALEPFRADGNSVADTNRRTRCRCGRGVVYVDGEKEIYARRSETAGWCAEY